MTSLSDQARQVLTTQPFSAESDSVAIAVAVGYSLVAPVLIVGDADQRT